MFTIKTCDHHDLKKKQAVSYFVMQAGLGNNEFCLCGLKPTLVVE